jgi:sugar phosphate isomerase/epimerase
MSTDRGDRLRTWLPELRGGRFAVGVNLPWVDYGTDFGTSSWHTLGGIGARPASLERLDRTLAALAADGIRLVRLFMLCDARSGIRFDPGGLPLALDEEVFADMDALLATAERHGVRVMPVLFDFHLCKPPRIVGGVQLGGRGRLVATEEGRTALVERVVQPLARRYGDRDAIAAWDLFNEPEWCLRLLPPLTRAFDPFEALQGFLESAVTAVRSSARQPVTVGSAGTWQLDLVRTLELDFYQVHWYERFGRKALDQPVSRFDLDAPVILGEFSGRHANVADVLQAARRAGYVGAFVWSVLAEDNQSAYPAEVVEWARAHAREPVTDSAVRTPGRS